MKLINPALIPVLAATELNNERQPHPGIGNTAGAKSVISRATPRQRPDNVLTQTVRRGSGFSSEERRDQTIELQAELDAASETSTGTPHEPEDFRATRLPEVGLEPTQGITPTGF